MLTDFVKDLHNFSAEEIEQFELALRKEKTSRKINEILDAAKQARKEQKGRENLCCINARRNRSVV